VSPHVEVITGVNLPMLIKLARPQTSTDLPELAREMRDHGRTAIWVASDLLRGETASDKGGDASRGGKPGEKPREAPRNEQ
jgi:mannose/fructose-specific phosphotransferase system component IIA